MSLWFVEKSHLSMNPSIRIAGFEFTIKTKPSDFLSSIFLYAFSYKFLKLHSDQ